MKFPALVGLLSVLAGMPVTGLAGGGPGTTLVVVNAASPLSKRVANEYVALRHIDDTHLLWLDDVPSMQVIGIDTFRSRILSPVQDYLSRHGLEDEIDTITYSADFPYAVDFSSDLATWSIRASKYLGTVGSLTSMTYFARRVEAADAGYVGQNYYFREFAGPERKPSAHTPVAAQRLGAEEARKLQEEAQKALRRRKPEVAAGHYQAIADSAPSDPQNWVNLARSQAAAGRKEAALASLERAMDYGWTNSVQLERDRYLMPLRDEPRFEALIEHMENAWGPFQLTHGFSNAYVWSNPDLAFWDEGDELDRYYLSTMLAYTGERGNSFPEIMRYISAAVSSDGTRPDGTVYLMENSNVRSRTRQALFPATLGQLKERGHRAEVLFKGDRGQDGILPFGKDDVTGVVAGFYRYDWSKTGSRILPGAIAESLTSYGGDFDRAVQTKLTEFLRHGAAGSSGAVAEPYAFQEKFPVPLIHAWYTDGCSLAEAFYQSVKVPYQLIVVGDPLARPFATFADVSLKAPALSEAWTGEQSLEIGLRTEGTVESRLAQLWVNGQLLAESPAGEPVRLDTRTLEDGSHRLQIVAVEDSAIETRSIAEYRFEVRNTDRRVRIEPIEKTVSLDGRVLLRGTAPGARSVELFRGYRSLGRVSLQGDTWQVQIPAGNLGAGPVEIVAIARFDTGADVRSEPLALEIGLPSALAPALERRPAEQGFRAQVRDFQGGTHEVLLSALDGQIRELARKRIKAQAIRLDGYFRVEKSGFYQLGVRTAGRVRIAINGGAVTEKQLPPDKGEFFLPLSLQAGWHRLDLEMETDTSARPFLKVVLAGDRVPAVLEGFSESPG